jgi:hypothetical protein
LRIGHLGRVLLGDFAEAFGGGEGAGGGAVDEVEEAVAGGGAGGAGLLDGLALQAAVGGGDALGAQLEIIEAGETW